MKEPGIIYTDPRSFHYPRTAKAGGMAISGLVIVFSDACEQYPETMERLRNHSQIELGAIQGNQCAVVVDAETTEEDHLVSEWIQSLPGVDGVRVAFVGFDEDEDSAFEMRQRSSEPS